MVTIPCIMTRRQGSSNFSSSLTLRQALNSGLLNNEALIADCDSTEGERLSLVEAVNKGVVALVKEENSCERAWHSRKAHRSKSQSPRNCTMRTA